MQGGGGRKYKIEYKKLKVKKCGLGVRIIKYSRPWSPFALVGTHYPVGVNASHSHLRAFPYSILSSTNYLNAADSQVQGKSWQQCHGQRPAAL